MERQQATVNVSNSRHAQKKMFALGVEGLKSYIKTIGLFNAKAGKNAIKTL